MFKAKILNTFFFLNNFLSHGIMEYIVAIEQQVSAIYLSDRYLEDLASGGIFLKTADKIHTLYFIEEYNIDCQAFKVIHGFLEAVLETYQKA